MINVSSLASCLVHPGKRSNEESRQTRPLIIKRRPKRIRRKRSISSVRSSSRCPLHPGLSHFMWASDMNEVASRENNEVSLAPSYTSVRIISGIFRLQCGLGPMAIVTKFCIHQAEPFAWALQTTSKRPSKRIAFLNINLRVIMTIPSLKHGWSVCRRKFNNTMYESPLDNPMTRSFIINRKSYSILAFYSWFMK